MLVDTRSLTNTTAKMQKTRAPREHQLQNRTAISVVLRIFEYAGREQPARIED
jgi:hypothetical protein